MNEQDHQADRPEIFTDYAAPAPAPPPTPAPIAKRNYRITIRQEDPATSSAVEKQQTIELAGEINGSPADELITVIRRAVESTHPMNGNLRSVFVFVS